jgi:hypothetical protein
VSHPSLFLCFACVRSILSAGAAACLSPAPRTRSSPSFSRPCACGPSPAWWLGRMAAQAPPDAGDASSACPTAPAPLCNGVHPRWGSPRMFTSNPPPLTGRSLKAVSLWSACSALVGRAYCCMRACEPSEAPQALRTLPLTPQAVHVPFYRPASSAASRTLFASPQVQLWTVACRCCITAHRT